MTYNLISIFGVPQNKFRTVNDVSDEKPQRGNLRFIQEPVDVVKVIGLETEERLYQAIVPAQIPKQAKFSNYKPDNMWHGRMGHISDEVLRETLSLINGINKMDVEATKHREESALVSSKMILRKVVTCEKIMAVKPLDRVFSDLVGPMIYESKGKSKYLVTVFDLFSRYSLVRYIHLKIDIGNAFIELVNELESLLNKKAIGFTTISKKPVGWLKWDCRGE